MKYRKNTGWIFLLAGVLLFGIFTVVQYFFATPYFAVDIATPSKIFREYFIFGDTLIFSWMSWSIPGILLILGIIRLNKVMQYEFIPQRNSILVIGVVSWVLQFFGLVRWVFVAPVLSRDYWSVQGAASATYRQSLETLWATFQSYTGSGVAQFVAFNFVALWMIFISGPIRRSPLFKPWMGWMALLVGILIAMGSFAALDEGLHLTATAPLYPLWSFCDGVAWPLYSLFLVIIAWPMLNNETYEEQMNVLRVGTAVEEIEYGTFIAEQQGWVSTEPDPGGGNGGGNIIIVPPKKPEEPQVERTVPFLTSLQVNRKEEGGQRTGTSLVGRFKLFGFKITIKL